MSGSTPAPRVVSSALSAYDLLFSLCRNTHVSTSHFSPWSKDLAPCSTWLAAHLGPSWRDDCFWSCLSCTCQVPCTVSCCSTLRIFFTKGCGSSPAVPFCADVPSLPVQSVHSQLTPSPPTPSARPHHQTCCSVPVPGSLVLCLMHLFWSILFTHTNQDHLQTY